MSEPTVTSKAWLEELSRTLAAESSGGSFDERILDVVHRIDARYSVNFDLDRDEQLPLAVFERLAEKLLSIIEVAASPSLLDALRGLPDETFGKTQLVESARGHLLEKLERVLASTPENLEARLARGKLLLDNNDAEAAADDFSEVIRQDSRHWDARHEEVRALLKQRHDLEALARLDELVQLQPDDAFGLLERAQLLMRYHHVPEALRDIERLIGVTDDPDALLFAAKQLLFVGRAGDAAAVCRRLPASAESLLVLGKSLLDAGDPATATTTLEGALRQTRGLESLQRFASAKVSALKLLGDAHAQLGDAANALDRYIEAMSFVGSNYELRRAVVKLAWEQRAGEPAPPATGASGDEAFEARWIEPNMSAEFVDGKPVEITSAELGLAPYLERLPWVTTVERLILPAGPRDNREALVTLFRLSLPGLHHLDIRAERFGFPCLFRLVEAPFFARLEDLFLRECDLDAPALQLLADRIPRGLRNLGVLVANARPKLPRAVTLADQFRNWELPNLESLELHDCSLNADEVMALTEARLPKLAVLGLTGNDLRGLDLAIFLDSALVKRLHAIYFSDTGAEPELLLGLLDRFDKLALRRVRAHRNWTDDELRAIVNHPAFRRLEQVDLGMSSIPDDSWLALLD